MHKHILPELIAYCDGGQGKAQCSSVYCFCGAEWMTALQQHYFGQLKAVWLWGGAQ